MIDYSQVNQMGPEPGGELSKELSFYIVNGLFEGSS